MFNIINIKIQKTALQLMVPKGIIDTSVICLIRPLAGNSYFSIIFEKIDYKLFT